MAAVLFRLILLVAGLTAVEIGLGSALVEASLGGWILVFVVGLPLIVAGSAGFVAPLLGSRPKQGAPNDA